MTYLVKRDAFGHVAKTPVGIKHNEYKWIFVQKRKQRMMSLDIKHDLLHKVSRRDQVLIMEDLLIMYAVILILDLVGYV